MTRFLLFCLWLLIGDHSSHAAVTIDMENPCKHEEDKTRINQWVREDGVERNFEELKDGETVYNLDLEEGTTDLYQFQVLMTNTTLLNQKDENRKVIFNLEPCHGVVYLFIRKTRKCFPDPYSCLHPSEDAVAAASTANSQFSLPQESDCLWTHFSSKIDGTRDGASTMFELPLTSTSYYLAVYGKTKAEYSLMAMTDPGAFPRPGGQGQLHAYQTKLNLEVDLSWQPAYFKPATIYDETAQVDREIGTITRYHVYSAMLLDDDKRTNAAVFLTDQKIMNTACGIRKNTEDRPYNYTYLDQCGAHGYCNQTINGLIHNKRYVFNVVAESNKKYNVSYSGIIVQTNWEVKRQEYADSDVLNNVLPALFGGVLGLTVTLYIWMVNWY